MNAIIIDDEPIARDIIKQFINKEGRLNIVAECKSIAEANEALEKNAVHLIFLDINLGKNSPNGIEFSKSLSTPIKIIFTTAYREFALEGFEVNAIDYLVKPIEYDRFLKAINKFYSIENNIIKDEDKKGNFLFIKDGTKFLKISTEEIVFIEANGEYINIVTADNRRIMTFERLKNIESKLSKNFIRVHRSYIVAINKINEVNKNFLRIGTTEIPISASYKTEINKIVTHHKITVRT